MIPEHGGKLQGLVPQFHHFVVLDWLTKPRLLDLQYTPLKVTNHELISALIEFYINIRLAQHQY